MGMTPSDRGVVTRTHHDTKHPTAHQLKNEIRHPKLLLLTCRLQN